MCENNIAKHLPLLDERVKNLNQNWSQYVSSKLSSIM